MKSVDKDSDGTIDMAEAKQAGMARFAMLDKDKDGTIDSKEAGMDISKADPDKDGTLDKAEFETALVTPSRRPTPTTTAPSMLRSWRAPRARSCRA